jgi:hypothetical protein
MPVPDHVRDDGSGIQKSNTVMTNWIPGQSRNDETYINFDLLVIKTPLPQELRKQEKEQTEIRAYYLPTGYPNFKKYARTG